MKSNVMHPGQTPGRSSQRLGNGLRALFHEIEMELRHLNSARIGKSELSRLAPRDRARAVKAALAAHHRSSARCC